MIYEYCMSKGFPESVVVGITSEGMQALTKGWGARQKFR